MGPASGGAWTDDQEGVYGKRIGYLCRVHCLQILHTVRGFGRVARFEWHPHKMRHGGLVEDIFWCQSWGSDG